MHLNAKFRRFIFRFRFAILILSMASTVAVFIAVTEQYKTASAVSVISSRCVLTPVIDAGHGGEDGGATSVTGASEADINLKISRKLELLLAFCGSDPVITRPQREISYPSNADTVKARKIADQKNRVMIVNSTPNAVLISIHQNKYTAPQPSGAQVLYGRGEQSKMFGESIQELFLTQLDTSNRRTAVKASDEIFLMYNANCPAILVECGFLSNPNEASLLETETYQLKVAAVIAAGYLSSADILTEFYGGTYEGKNDVLLH